MLSLMPEATYFPFLAQMVVTRYCNLSCGYCNEFNKAARPVPLAQLKQQIDRLRQLGTLALTLTGGEPLTHPEIFEVIHYARRKLAAVGMISNAYLLKEGTIAQLNEAGLTSLQISVDGVEQNEITLKALRPLKSRLELVAQKARFLVNLNSVIGPTPLPELIEVFEFARRHRFASTAQVIHDKNGQALLATENRAAYSQAVKKYSHPLYAVNWRQTCRLIMDGRAPFKCRAGSRYLYINEFGNVCWCSSTQGRFQKPLAQYTTGDLKAQFYTRKGCEERCTLGCVRTSSILEGFRRYGVGENCGQPEAAGICSRNNAKTQVR